MIYYEYDASGWLIGWHEDAQRPNSTSISYAPIPPHRARFVVDVWVDDPEREQSEARAAAMASAVAAVQARLDTVAQSWGYDSIFTACTYADEPAVPQFQAEGQSLRAWRSTTWAACYANTSAASIEELFAALPPPPDRPVA